MFRANASSVVSNCYNYGDVTGSIQVGGIVGGNRANIKDSYCYSEAKIKGTAAKDRELDGSSGFIGAIAGRLEGTAATRTGGGLCDADGNPITANA